MNSKAFHTIVRTIVVLLLLLMLVVLLFGCIESKAQYKKAASSAEVPILIYDQGYCKLYKIRDGSKDIYWSICKDTSANSSIAIY